jgi:beta-lactamase class A
VEPGRPRARATVHGRGAGGEEGLIAWAAVDPATGAVEQGHGAHVFAAASTIKLFVYSAYRRSGLGGDEVARQRQTGGSGVAEFLRTPLSLDDHSFLMLAVSDNASTNVLLDLLGFDAVAAEVERLGLTDTRVRRLMMQSGPENETTPLDLAHGLARLLEEPFAEDMLAALRVAAERESFLPHLLPGVAVASKSGDLETVRHEVAVLDQGERRLVTAVCSSPPSRPDELAAVAGQCWAA